jgi:hypothetical protein
MYKTIFKYRLDFNKNGKESLELPIDSEILSCELQDDEIKIWALINPTEEETELRFFEIFGTGDEIGCDMGISRKFIKTLLFRNGLVFHLFERTS